MLNLSREGGQWNMAFGRSRSCRTRFLTLLLYNDNSPGQELPTPADYGISENPVAMIPYCYMHVFYLTYVLSAYA